MILHRVSLTETAFSFAVSTDTNHRIKTLLIVNVGDLLAKGTKMIYTKNKQTNKQTNKNNSNRKTQKEKYTNKKYVGHTL